MSPHKGLQNAKKLCGVLLLQHRIQSILAEKTAVNPFLTALRWLVTIMCALISICRQQLACRSLPCNQQGSLFNTVPGRMTIGCLELLHADCAWMPVTISRHAINVQTVTLIALRSAPQNIICRYRPTCSLDTTRQVITSLALSIKTTASCLPQGVNDDCQRRVTMSSSSTAAPSTRRMYQ